MRSGRGLFPLRSKRFAVSARELFTRTAGCLALSALDIFVETRLRRPCLDRFAVFTKASRNSLIEAEGQSDLTF